MSPLVWMYDAPFLRPDVTVAFTEDGQLVGAYRKKQRKYVLTYDLIRTEAERFDSEDAARGHLQAVADRRWPVAHRPRRDHRAELARRPPPEAAHEPRPPEGDTPMSMTIVDIEGPSLDRFINDMRHLAEQVEAGRVRRIAAAIDDLDGSFKIKANEGIWSPPIGTPRAVTR